MTERQHTKDILAEELRKAGLLDMSIKAAQGYYHDYLSPLDFPDLKLAHDLKAARTPAALALLRRHMNGEFDANLEESDEWARSAEGQAIAKTLPEELRKSLKMDLKN